MTTAHSTTDRDTSNGDYINVSRPDGTVADAEVR